MTLPQFKKYVQQSPSFGRHEKGVILDRDIVMEFIKKFETKLKKKK